METESKKSSIIIVQELNCIKRTTAYEKGRRESENKTFMEQRITYVINPFHERPDPHEISKIP